MKVRISKPKKYRCLGDCARCRMLTSCCESILESLDSDVKQQGLDDINIKVENSVS